MATGSTATLTAIFAAQDKISDKLAGIERSSNSLKNTFGKVAAAAASVFAVDKVINFGKVCAIAANKYESGMKEVFTLLPGLSDDAMKSMTLDVKDFSKEMGTATTQTVPALYQAISAGIPKENVFDFLKTADKAAIGGITSLETAVDGLSSVTNAYGSAVLSTQRASDLMFTTVKLGKTNFEQLAGSLFNVVPTAVGAGVAFEDISAALAAMTAQGIPTSVATTQLRQAIVELSKSGTETDKTFRSVAGKGFKEFISSGKNLQDAFQLLEIHAKKTGKGVNDMFGSVEAGNAVLSLTGQGTQKFTDSMQAMQEAAGATDAAFNTMEGSMERKLAKMQTAWEVSKIGIGETLIDAVLPILEYFADNMDGMSAALQTGFSVIGNGLKALWDVASPILGWVKANPTLVQSALAGIGTAIITYKVFSGITKVASAVKKLGLAISATPIGIFTLVASVLVAVGVAVYQTAQKMKKANLDSHFGKITLSAEELQGVAQSIVRTDSLGKLGKAMDALDGMDSIAKGMQDAVETLDRMNWKVSIGLKLSESDASEYKSAVATFVKDTQELVGQKQYAINLALSVFTDDGETGKSIRDSINLFYNNNVTELSDLGYQLQEAVNDAFADGLLTIDEVKEITELQQQMANITAKLSETKFEAKLEMLDLKYSGSELSGESFKQLQDDINAEVEKATVSYDDSLLLLISNAKLMLDDGAIDKEEYDRQVAEFKNKYLENVGELQLKASGFEVNTITDTFGSELSAEMSKMTEAFKNEFDLQSLEMSQYGAEHFDMGRFYSAAWENVDLDGQTRENVKELFNKMKPLEEDLQTLADTYRTAGQKVPEGIQMGIMDINAIGALTGDMQSISILLGGLFSEQDPAFQAMITQLHSAGGGVPDAIVKGMELNKDRLSTAGTSLLDTLKTRLQQGFSATIPVNATVKMNTTVIGMPNSGESYGPPAPTSVPGNALGTINAQDMFIAGEEGPELIVGAKGSTVFPNRETEKILSFLPPKGDLNVPVPREVNRTESYDRSERRITIDLHGSGTIKVSGGMKKQEVIELMVKKLRPTLLDILEKEMTEEGDHSYGF